MESFEIVQSMGAEDYRKACRAAYSSSKWSWLRPILLGVLVVIGLYLVQGEELPVAGGLFILIAIVLSFRKPIYVWRAVRGVEKSNMLGEETTVRFEADGSASSSRVRGTSTFHLKDMQAWCRYPAGLLIFPQHGVFFALKQDAFSGDQAEELVALLRELKVPELSV